MISHDLSQTRQENRMIQFMPCYNTITSTNAQTFCMPVVSASLTILTSNLPQSRDRSYYVSRLTPPTPRLQNHAHTTSLTLPACNISLVSRTLPSPQDGIFVELILLYTQKMTLRWIVQGIELWPSQNSLKLVSNPSPILYLRLPFRTVSLVTSVVKMGSVTRT